MRARGYLLALVAMTLAQACVLVGVYGSRLADLNVPLTFAWTDPPASSELWRPNYTLSDPPQTPNSAASFTQTDTMLALSGATLLKNGTWYSGDGRLAAPGVSSQLDFPAPLERGDISFGLAIGLVAATPAALANLFLLASFLAVLWVAAAFLWAWRPGSRWLVPLAALAIANAPYHFVRENFFAANYVLVVPTVACCVLLARRRDLGRLGRIAVVAWVVAVPFFGLYSAITALVLASWTTLGMLFIGWRRSGGRARRALVATGWLWAWTSAWLLIDLLPTMSYWAEHGSVATLERTVAVSDKYALRLLDLVTQPDTLLASPLLRRSSWLATAEFKGEGVVVGGFIGLATFALLLWWLATAMFSRRAPGGPAGRFGLRWTRQADVRSLAWLLSGVVLVCSAGGIGSLANATGLSVIKSWERIAFASYPIMVMMVLIVAAAWRAASRRTPVKQSLALGSAALVGAVVAGLLTGIPWSADGHGAASSRAAWSELDEFYKGVESASGMGPVLFLPSNGYPEGRARCNQMLYDELIGYALTRETRWGSAANRGRETAERQFAITMSLVGDTPAAAVGLARSMGYTALVVDQRGLPDTLRRPVIEALQHESSMTFGSRSEVLQYFDISGASSVASPGVPTRLTDHELNRLYPPCHEGPSSEQ